MLTGVVIKAYQGYYDVQTEQKVVLCTVRGKLKQERFILLVGDKVEYKISSGNKGVIETILPRSSLLQRPLVANVNQVVLAFACHNPDYSMPMVDRFLVLAEVSQLQSVLCFNKLDLADAKELESVAMLYRSIGYPVVLAAARQNTGIDELRSLLNCRITVFAGPSGLGKSTL